MAKLSKVPPAGNRKLTDYFPSSSQLGSSQPPSSPPAPTSPARRKILTSSSKQQNSVSILSQNSVHVSKARHHVGSANRRQTTAIKPTAVPAMSPVTPKKAPPPHDVISISSNSTEKSHISISSTSKVSVISISSSSSIHPLGVFDKRANPLIKNIAATLQDTVLKKEDTIISIARCHSRKPAHLNTLSPRSPLSHSPRVKKEPPMTQSMATPKKGRKRRNSFSDGEDIDLSNAKECIITARVVAEKNVRSPKVSKTSTPKKGPSPKKKRKSNHDGDASELSVIPSSQSDERELVVPETSQKDLQEVQASVLAWQELSQQEEQIEFEPGWGNMDMDISASVSYSRMQVSPQPSMVPPQPPTPISSPLSSVSCGKSPLASWQRTPCASPTKNRLSVVVPSLTQRKPVVSTNIVASPRIPSTTSSLTKVSSSPILLEKKEEAIAESSKPESPRILTEDAKTKALIESIKAKTLRNVSPASEDSEKVYEALGELVESDDDLDFDFDCFGSTSKGKKSKSQTRKSLRFDSPASGSQSTSVRRQREKVHSISPSPTPSITSRRRSSRLSAPKKILPTSGSSPLTSPPPSSPVPKKKKAAVLPFASLMKEKNADTKRFSKYDLPLTQAGRELRMKEALAFGESFLHRSTSPGPSCTIRAKSRRPAVNEEVDENDMDVDDDDSLNVMDVAKRAHLLDDGEGNAMGRILEHDRLNKGKEKAQEEVFGVLFWEECQNAGTGLELDDLPELDLGDQVTGLTKLLKTYVGQKNIAGISTLLRHGAIFNDKSCLLEVLGWTFDLALSVPTPSLARDALNAFLNYCDECPMSDDAPIRFESVYFALNQLGAQAGILEKLSRLFEPSSVQYIDPEVRSDVLWRLVAAVTACARKKLIFADDVPEIIASLLLVAHEPSASNELKIDVNCAVDVTVNAYCGDESARGELEILICKKIFAIAHEYKPAHKAQMLSLISGSSHVSRRVCQWVAFGLLEAEDYLDLLADQSVLLPPLESIIALLSKSHAPPTQQYMPTPTSSPSKHRVPSSAPVFDVVRMGATDITDYTALGHSVEILSNVLTNVHLYTALDTTPVEDSPSEIFSLSQEMSLSPSPKKAVNVPLTDLEEITDLLLKFFGKIFDTRGVALERSNAKGAIQRLHMRVHYQRKESLECRNGGRQRKAANIRQYFAGK